MSGYICVIWLFFSTITVVPRVTGQGLATERHVVPEDTGATVRNSATKQVVPKLGLCRDGWSRGTMKEMFGKEIPICIQINPNPQTWTDAQTTCRKDYGFMLKLDSHVNVNNADIYTLLHTEDITEFWTGLHSEHGHLVWDDLLPNQLQPYNSVNATSTSIRPWSWNNDLTGNQQHYCGRMHIETEDDYRRKKRSPDDDSNDNIFPGLNLANFRHRINNGFDRRNNHYPPTAAFGSLLARKRMSDQLAELPDLQNGNSQSESNSPDSDSQSGSVTTDTPTFDTMTTFDTDTDTVAFGASLGAETNEHGTPTELVTSVKNVAATLRPGMDVAQPDSPIEALKMSENLEAFNNENPSSFDNKASDSVGNGGSDGSQITETVSAFGSALFDSISDEKPVQVESDNVGTETAIAFGSLSTTAPEIPSVTFGDDKDRTDLLSPSSDEPKANIGDVWGAIYDSKPTNKEGLSNVGDSQTPSDDGSSNQLIEQFGSVVGSDGLSNIDDSLSLSDDSKTTSDVPGNDIIDSVVDSLNESPSDVKDIIENVVENFMSSNDEHVGDVSSLIPGITLSEINNVVEDLSPPSENEFSPNGDLISDDIVADKSTNTEDNPVLYPQLNNMADRAEGIKDIVDDIKSDVNEGNIEDLIPSFDDITPDRNLDDEESSDKQILSNFASIDDAPEIEPSIPSTNSPELLDTFEDRLEKIGLDDIPTDDTTEPAGTDNGLGEILNPMGISDDAITDLEDIDIPDNTDDVELAGDLLDKIGDDKYSKLGEFDLSDRVESIQDNLESNADRQLENINNLSDALSDQDAVSQNLARPSLMDDVHDAFESNIDTDDFVDSLADTDHSNLQEITKDLLPDETESLTDDLHDINDSGNVDTNTNNDAGDDFSEMRELLPHENDLSDIDDVIEDDHTQDVIDTTDSFTELEHDDKDRLTDYEATTESRQANDMEAKRDFEWSDVGELENDNQEVEPGNSDMSDDKELHDDNDFNEEELENRQVVVDGSFGQTKDDDQTDVRDNDNTHDNEDYENDSEGLTKVADSYPEDQDEGDTFNELPNMAEDVVEENLKHSIASVLNAEMKLSTCDVKLPSVCFSYEVLVSSGASTCEDGWYGHVLLDTCYKVLDKKMSYPAAVSRCKSLNARVIIASSEFERRYSLMAVQQEGKLHRGGKFWIESLSDNCKLFSERGVQTVPSCRAAMNVICVKDSKPLSVYSTNKISDGNDEVRFYDENGDYVMFTSEGDANNLPCRLTSGASEFPVLWFKDGVMVSSKDKQVSQNLSLHIGKELLSAFRLVTDRSLTIPTLQGQYWCEVWDRQTLTRMRSRAFNVRFSDVISFHGSMEAGDFNHENEVLFNMMNREFPKLSAVEADIQKVFNDELSSIKAYVPNVQSVSTVIDGIRSDRPVIEYHAFFTMSRDYTTQEEQLLYSRLKAGLRSKLGNQNYIMELPGQTPINSFRTMSLQSTVSCPGASLQTTKDLYGQTIPAKEFSFPTTMLGEFANSLQNCSQTNQLPAGSARCLGDFYTGALWSEVVAYECIEEITYNAQNEQKWEPSPYTAELTNLAKATADAGNAEKLVSEVAQIVKVAPKFTPTDINKIADVLEHTTQVRNLPREFGENVLKTVDRLMADSFNEAHVANVETNAANRIIKSLERFAENADLGNQQQVRFVSDNVAVEIWDLEQDGKPVIGLAVETSTDGVSQAFHADSISTVYNKSHLYDANVDAAIELPEEVFSKKEKGARVSDRLTMIVFRKSKLFQAAITDGGRRISPTDQQMAHLNSYVISASIAGKKIQHLNEKVKCIFKPKKESDGQNKCVWWDFTMNENKGGWSSMGCVYDGMVNGRDVCLCDHLTNFAVLIDFYGQGKPIPEHHELSLSIITVLGLSCSILGLSLTIISFLFFRKLRKGRAQQTLFNLSLSLLLSMLVFLVGIKQTHNDYVCIVVAILLHYFILVSFMWMLMEAILQYLTFVKILGTYITRFTLKTVLPAWGLPLLPVISVLSIDYTLYKGGPDYCWMDLSVFYYAFAVPVTCIIIINITIFIVTIISIFRRGKGLRSNQKKQKMAMTNLQAALTSFILLGLTWIFGYLAISDARLLFQYVFTILNSLQGFFIFILFVVRKKKVRDQWYIICCKGNEKDRVSRSLSASNSLPSTYSNGSRNSRKDGRERDRSDSTKTIQSTYSNSSNGFTNYGYDHSYEFPFSRHDRRAFRNF